MATTSAYSKGRKPVAIGEAFPLSAGGLLAACGGSSGASSRVRAERPRRGRSSRAVTCGWVPPAGAKDTIDAHLPNADPDDMRCWNLYEPLAVRPPSFGTPQMMVAESLEPEHNQADSWIVKIRPGIEFHNGKSVTAEDVIFSLQRIVDAKNPKVGPASIGYIDIKKRQEALEFVVADPAEGR